MGRFGLSNGPERGGTEAEAWMGVTVCRLGARGKETSNVVGKASERMNQKGNRLKRMGEAREKHFS